MIKPTLKSIEKDLKAGDTDSCSLPGLMRITPTTKAVIYGFEDQLIEIPLMTLSVWTKALRCLLDTGVNPTTSDVEGIVREQLKTPVDYPLEHVVEHLEICLEETHEHYGVSA